MSTQLELLEEQALQLTPGERAAFAQWLLANLDEEDDVEAAWAVEVKRRLSQLESGEVRALDKAEALAQLRSEYQ